MHGRGARDDHYLTWPDGGFTIECQLLYIYDIGHGSGARDGQFTVHLPSTRLLKILNVFANCILVLRVYSIWLFITVAYQYVQVLYLRLKQHFLGF